MNYNKAQKFLSFLLIFILFFSITFRLPPSNYKVGAASNDVFNLVSIIVDEETYPKIENELRIYGRNISNTLENTKVVILPVPANVNPFQIASMNEGLFYEGYKSLASAAFESKLVGTVLVGNIPLPEVYKDNDTARTVLPYTDFDDKLYIYDKELNKYEYNSKNISGIKPEVWHGVISPNTGTKEGDIEAIKDYFAKNNDFYTGNGMYNPELNTTNGNSSVNLSEDYNPFIFYYDSIRESSAVNYGNYLAYQEGYLPNKEDIVYNRYTMELAKKLKEQVLSYSNDEMYDLIKSIDPDTIIEAEDLEGYENVPDIQSRYIINNAVKKFIEIFSGASMGELREDVYGAGRYNNGQEVNVDFIPYLITVLDVVNDEIIKDLNNDLEDKIDDLVETGFSRKIPLPTKYSHINTLKGRNQLYENFLYGKKASDISQALECSIYRGSLDNGGQLVEANRGVNILNIEPDIEKLEGLGQLCLSNLDSGASLEGIWGKNSPFNMDDEQASNGVMKLKNSDFKGAITPIFDIAGSTKNADEKNIYTPLDCIENNYLMTLGTECNSVGEGGICLPVTVYRLPSEPNFGGAVGWTCVTDSNSGVNTYNFNQTFDQNYQNLKAGFCERLEIKIDGVLVKSDYYQEKCSTGAEEGMSQCECSDLNGWEEKTWEYKTIPSIIEHKSPTAEELTIQVNSMVTPALPVDKDRYVDFVGANGKYLKINYPYLFRLDMIDKSNITLETVSASLDKYLDEKSAEINEMIDGNKAALSQGVVNNGFVNEPRINHYLVTGAYPNANFDLKAYLKSKGESTIEVDGGNKEVSYYDLLVFALYWNNLNSVSSKYKYVFENYLSSQAFIEDKFYLPKNKNQYEIAYLGADGDSQNMYIGLNPDNKGENPFADIVGMNQDLSTKLLGLNIEGESKTGDSKNKYKCGSPEGVPIWEWIPAIMCRLEDMMPPTISIGDGNCGSSLLDLLTAEEVEEYNECNGDYNKNGVNDCLEKNLENAVLVLETDSDKHYYNSNIPLFASVKTKDGKDVQTIGATNIDFELIRLEKALDENKDISEGNIEVLYDESLGFNDKTVWDNYLAFLNQSIRATAGKAQYGVGVKSTDINVYFQAKINVSDSNSTELVNLKSELLKIEVRGERLFISSTKFENPDEGLDTEISNSLVQASEYTNVFLTDPYLTTAESIKNLINSNSLSEEKLVLNIHNISSEGLQINLGYPLNVSLYKGDVLLESLTLNNINNFVSLSPLKEAGEYKLEVTDNSGVKNSKIFSVTPGYPSDLDLNLGSNVLGIGGTSTTNYITILDKFGNVVSGDLYNIEMSISGNGVQFYDNSQSILNTTTFEGYKIFRLKSTDTTGDSQINLTVKNSDGERILEKIERLRTIEDFDISIVPSGEFSIGGGEYSFRVDVKDSNGVNINGLNSRIYLYIDSHYLDLYQSYFEIKNGSGEITFKTKTLAGKDIPIELQVEGLGKIISKTITINPDKPIKMDLVLSKSKMEATQSEFSNVQVELKDRYNNLVFNDSNTRINLEIPEVYSSILSSQNSSQTVKEGKTTFRIYGTINPGIGYFKTTSIPSLAQNSFVIEDSNDTLTINGVGENAGKIETYYLWNKEKIEEMQYNSIYTTLLGANYGDIEQKDYLAGSLIFNRNSKALAVTSVLNDPYLRNNTLSISKNGGILKLFSSSDLTQDISTNVAFENGKMYLDVFNNSLNTHIGKIFFNLSNGVKKYSCDGEISNCINESETSVFGKNTSSEYKFYTTGGNLQLLDEYGKVYFEIKNDGTINRYSNISFEFVSSNDKYLTINILYQGNIIGTFGINYIGEDLNITRDDLVLKNKLNSPSNGLFIYLNSLSYGYYTLGKEENLSVIIYYNDPFGSDKALNAFSRGNLYGFENYKDYAGIGWKDGNKTLLSFAAGKNVGEAVKDSASFSVINIGDPVVSLKPIRNTFNNSTDLKQFDSTVGKLINDDQRLVGFKPLDYNNDELSDVLLIKNDGRLQLLENKNNGEKFLDLGDLVYVADIGRYDTIQTGDFTGDGFDDIFFIGTDGYPYLLNNINKDFTRIALGDKFNLSGNIIRTKVFDMDNDGFDDIITLDDFGEINIFYGIGPSLNPDFTKLTVSNEYGLTLNSGVTNSNGLLYFDGLYQIGKTDYSFLIDENENYLNLLSNALSNTQEIDAKADINYDLINNYLFEQIPYSKSESYSLEGVNVEDLINLPESIEQTTFIKSEYSEVVGLKMEKTVSGKGEKVVAGDTLATNIKITNTSRQTVSNIAYIEKAYDFVSIDDQTVTNSLKLPIKKPSASYDFLIDNFSLAPGESITIEYLGVMEKIKYLDIRVGLFEDGEDGDDPYGDIIVKASTENCGEPVDIFRSVSVRLYEKGVKDAICDNSALPEQFELNSVDANGNGIPDYFETLKEDEAAMQQYSTDVIKDIYTDSDGDGVPDWDDDFNLMEGFTIDLGELGKGIEMGLDQVQEIVDGLSCGFNNGACFSTPLNWAPLAPGSDPTFMGSPRGDGLKINEGLPVFSSLTGVQTTCGYTPCCIPAFRPLSPLGYLSAPTCGPNSAGGQLGVWNSANTFRLFVTPTLTGGIGIAACFLGPAIIAGYEVPPGYHPIMAGGNCVVVAKAIVGCSNDGSDGDPSSLGIPNYGNGGTNGFGVINGNCTVKTPKTSVVLEYVEDYYKHITGGSKSQILNSDLKGVLVEDHSTFAGESLLSINGTGTPVDFEYDFESKSFNFGDIKEIVQKRVGSFPDFLMNWVTAQIEEIVSKLTNFPTLFIILPDFSGIYDFSLDWDQNRENWNKNKKTSEGLITINQKDSNDSILSSVNEKVQTANSSVKEAYEFISTLPFVNLEQETVNVSIPWISENELEKGWNNRKLTVEERKKEIFDATESWSFGASCEYISPEEQAACEERNNISEKAVLQANSLVRSLEANIEAIEDYKNIPEKINKLLDKKEDYLEQIICNVDSVSEIMGGRIGRNGEIFKTWVELYILIKAILKSWQLLIDVYIEYEEGCRECKNERHDLLYYIFKLISMTIPDMPVIEFPKWPDIIIDLHNIRAGLNVSLPEFNITPRPIILPPLPSLSLPSSPSGNLNLPELPVIPKLEIPDLPDIPSLPSVDLPDLPPAPSLPNLLSDLEIILDIGKLVTKAMCILKSSSFVPEWRAGDQIAFLTERNGYLPLDFIDLNLPQFTLPFVDAIQVTSFVNLEFDTAFITELARQIAMPINRFNSDFTNLFKVSIQDLDFTGKTPSEVNVNIDDEGSVDSNMQDYAPEFNLPIIDSNLQGNNGDAIPAPLYIVNGLYKYLYDKVSYIEKNKDVIVSGKEFKKSISEYLASERISNDPGYDEIRELWNNVNSYTFSGEDTFIANLEKESKDKFDLVKDILNTELVKNKKLREDFNNSLNSGIKKVSYTSSSNVEEYNTQLDKYNKSTFENFKKVINYDSSTGIENEIKVAGEDLIYKSENFFGKYSENYNYDDLLAENTVTVTDYTSQNTCSSVGNGEYSYNYEGLYVIEDGKSYILFDYKKELYGDEVTEVVDIDLDGDDDLLYFMNGAVYFKENMSNQNNKIYLNEYPSVISQSNNKFLNNNFIEAVNDVKSYISANNALSISFLAQQGVSNYRLGYYDMIDKYYNIKNTSYIPEYKKRTIIDAISGIGTVNLMEENVSFSLLKDIIYINNVGDLRGIEIETSGLNNIKDDLNSGKVVSIGNGTSVYSGDSVTTLKYIETGSDEIKNIIIPKNRHIQAKTSLNVVGIIGDGYIRNGEIITYSGTDIRALIGKPLFPGTKIKYMGNNEELKENTYIDLRYYDNSTLNLNFNYDSSWELYDLGIQRVSSYSIITESENNFYYARLNSFEDGIDGTLSNLVLLSPQKEADQKSPEIINVSSFKVPVYQKKSFELSEYIYEDLGIGEIVDIYIDFDLDIDSNGDGNSKNDNDSEINDKINIIRDNEGIIIEFGIFEELVSKKIGIIISDSNGNKSINEVNFEVYSPTPEISNLNNNLLSGQLNEVLSDQPVSIFRVRGGVITRLENTEGLTTTISDDGKYQFQIPEELNGIKIEKNGEIVAIVDEVTGKITINNPIYSIKVLPSNDSKNDILYPKIILKNLSEDVFYEGIKVNSSNPVEIVNNFSNVINLDSRGIFVTISNPGSYTYEILPLSTPINPGTLIISRVGTTTKEELFTVFPDGRINTLNENYIIEYDFYESCVVLKLIDKHFNREVAKILYKVSSDYVIQ